MIIEHEGKREILSGEAREDYLKKIYELGRKGNIKIIKRQAD